MWSFIFRKQKAPNEGEFELFLTSLEDFFFFFNSYTGSKLGSVYGATPISIININLQN